MAVRTKRLTKTAKILILTLVLVAVAGASFFAVKSGLVKTEKKDNVQGNVAHTEAQSNNQGNTSTPVQTNPSSDDGAINLSLDEWVGWLSVLDANGGLTTQPGSIYDKLGLQVNIHIINDATQSSNALIKGSLDAAGYTINRTAFLSNKFNEAGLKVVMPYITNYSNGGDGIIATTDYQTVESLVNAKIGVPQFSEAHSLVIWFVNQSDLSGDQKKQIIDNLIFFETPDEAAKAFFAGQIDVAATWQPYLTQAMSSTDAHVLFSTASSTRLIMDGILFRDDFAKANPDKVSAFIDGALQAMDLYDTEFDVARATLPMFNGMSDSEIKASTEDAALADWNANMTVLQNEAKSIFTDMCDVWASVGEVVKPEMVNDLFDVTYIEALGDKYETLTVQEQPKVVVTEQNREEIINTEALLTKSASVNFVINTAKFTDTADASAKLNDFIKIAQQLDGTIIQIEGNTDPNPNSDPTDQANILLSQQRAEAVKRYFVLQGIDPNRIITVGNGSSNPVVANDTEENRAMNRRTDVYFKCIE